MNKPWYARNDFDQKRTKILDLTYAVSDTQSMLLKTFYLADLLACEHIICYVKGHKLDLTYW